MHDSLELNVLLRYMASVCIENDSENKIGATVIFGSNIAGNCPPPDFVAS